MRKLFSFCLILLPVLGVMISDYEGTSAADYSYDGAGRLVGVDYGNGKMVSYHYDAVGNMLQKTVTPGASPSPSVAAAFGSGASAGIPGATTLSLVVSLDAGLQAGQPADWWLVAQTPSGWYYLSLDPFGWRAMSLESIPFTLQAPIMDLPGIDLGTVPGLPITQGTFAFYFAVDGNADGIPDVTWWDYSVAEVK